MDKGERDFNDINQLNELFVQFQELAKLAENSVNGRLLELNKCYSTTIEIKEILCVGDRASDTPEAVIVEDVDKKIWIIPECESVKSRDICPGMKLALEIEETIRQHQGGLTRFKKFLKITVLNKEALEQIEEKCSME